MSFKINGIEVKDLLKKDKELSEHDAEQEFLKRSYVGGAEYREGEYLIRHVREAKKSFVRRLAQAVFTNYVSPVIDIYNSYLHKDKVTRKNEGINQALYEAYSDDADLEGRSHAKVMREVSRLASLFGSIGILVDSPANLTGNLGSDLAKGLHTYTKLYTLENIINMIYDYSTGRPVLDIVVLHEDFNGGAYEHYVIYTTNEFFRFKKKSRGQPELISQGEHSLGLVPFIFHKNKDGMLGDTGVSDVVDIAELNKRVYQFDSAALEIIENTSFPFLEVPRMPNVGGDSGDIEIGTTNVLEFDADAQDGRHKYVEPSGDSLDAILNWRNQTLEDIRYHSKIGGTDSTKTGGNAESGVTLELRFQQLNAVLSEKAEAMENTETAIFNLVAMWNAMNYEGSVEYTRRFGVRDLGMELDVIMKADSFVSSAKFKEEASRKIISRVLGESATVEEVEGMVKDSGSPESGNATDLTGLNTDNG